MSPISSFPISPVQSAAQNSTGPSVMSQVAQQVSIAAGLESSLAGTLDNALNGDTDAATLIQLQVQTQGLSISTAALAQLVASLSDSAKQVVRGV